MKSSALQFQRTRQLSYRESSLPSSSQLLLPMTMLMLLTTKVCGCLAAARFDCQPTRLLLVER
jgi:hypothetical protein